jgi:hypothetical protein
MSAGGVGSALAGGATAALQLSQTLPPLVTAIDDANSDDLGTIATLVQRGADTTTKIVALLTAIKDIATAFHNGAAALPPAQRATLEAFASQLPQRLVEYLILANIESKAPRATSLLAIAGLAEDAFDSGDVDDPLSVPHRARRLRLDAVGKLAKDPATFFADLYGWGTPGFDGNELLGRIANVLVVAGLPATILRPPGQPVVLEALLVRASVQADPGDPGAPPGIWIRARRPATADFQDSTPIGGSWSFVVDAKARFEAGVEGGFFPSGRFVIAPQTGTAQADVSGGFRAQRGDGKPMTLLGLAGATRLEMQSFEARAGVRTAWVTPPGRADG